MNRDYEWIVACEASYPGAGILIHKARKAAAPMCSVLHQATPTTYFISRGGVFMQK